MREKPAATTATEWFIIHALPGSEQRIFPTWSDGNHPDEASDPNQTAAAARKGAGIRSHQTGTQPAANLSASRNAP